jgi:uncharacterized phage-associated protein
MAHAKHKPATLAKWFISRIDRDAGDDITHLKLQKLLYYAQAWHLANYDVSLFDEDMQAWAHGPVVPTVWRIYKEFGWNPLPPERPPNIEAGLRSYLEVVFGQYGGFTAKKLEELTHSEVPWREARGNIPPEAKCENVISKKTMRDYYRSRLRKAD